MANADGSVIIATMIDTDGIKKGTVEIKKDLLKMGDSADQANKTVGGDLAAGFKKLGAAISVAGIVDKMIDIGKEAISLGSDLEEVQNVVDVTFPAMSKQVNKFAKEAQKTAGLSEKMAKQYVGTFGAMADSFGFTEAEAYEMSTALTQLTGDVASFYNLAQDEAATKLKGVFTGETEALKEIGVVMTQAALDSYALANGFDKTTKSMSEQEKVALRYQFVMDQLAASSGDFVRTQDSWANQSKILALQWESLMATLGTGLISVLSPSIAFLNETVLPAINKFAEDFAEAMEPTPAEELEKSLKKFEKSVKSTTTVLEKTSESVELNASLAKLYADRLKELETTGLNTAGAQREYANAVDQLNQIYPELNLQIDEQTGLLDANSRAQINNLEALQQKYFFIALEAQYNEVLKAQADLQAQLYIAEARLNTIDTERANVLQALSASTGVAEEELRTYILAIQNSAGTMTDANGEVITLTASEQALYAELVKLDAEYGTTMATINEANVAMAGHQGKVDELTNAYNSAAEEVGGFSDSQEEATGAVEATSAALGELEAEYEAARESARESIDSQVGLLTELETKSKVSASEIVKNWGKQSVALDQYKANMQTAVEMGLDEALVKQLSDGSEESMQILNELVTDTDLNVDDINAAFRKTEESKQAVADAMAGVQTEMGEKLNAIEQQVSSEWGDMSDEVRTQIREMQSAINSLRGKTVYVNVVERKTSSGSSSGSSNTSQSSAPYAASNVSVPFLAKGTVIPPNAPFMAVLGDQKHGTNIEAPLSTIQEAVRVELGEMVSGMMAGFQALIEEQQATRKTLESIEIGDTVIGAAADRYNSKRSVMTGGGL